jgi:hypothetical protein
MEETRIKRSILVRKLLGTIHMKGREWNTNLESSRIGYLGRLVTRMGSVRNRLGIVFNDVGLLRPCLRPWCI